MGVWGQEREAQRVGIISQGHRPNGCNLLFPDINYNQQSKCTAIHELVKTHFRIEHLMLFPFSELLPILKLNKNVFKKKKKKGGGKGKDFSFVEPEKKKDLLLFFPFFLEMEKFLVLISLK